MLSLKFLTLKRDVYCVMKKKLDITVLIQFCKRDYIAITNQMLKYVTLIRISRHNIVQLISIC